MFGARIRSLRKELNLSQQELGRIINKPQTTISDWENEKTFPNINDALKLAAALGVSVSDLLGENQPKAVGE